MTPETADLRNQVIIIVNGQELYYDHATLGINFSDSNNEILTKVNSLIREARGVSLTDNSDEYSYTVTKITESQNIFIYPKPDAGI